MAKSFIKGRILGMKYAIIGAFTLLRTEPSIQVQTVVALGITAAGFYFDISATEWMLQTFAIGLVISIEGLNTAIEDIADFIHPDFNVKIGRIKDIAAGAVGIAALTAVIIACIIYIPKF